MILNENTDAGSAPQHVLGAALKQFKSATRNPEIYLQAQEKKAAKHSELVKQLYDYAKTTESNRTNAVPDELIVEHMDDEQIWQQLELQNEFLWSRCLKLSGKMLSGKDEAFRLDYKVAGDEDDEDESNEDDDEDDELAEEETDDGSELGTDDDEDDDDDDVNNDDDDSETDGAKRSTKKPGRKSIVDDKFFKLSEMEEFLEAEDRKEMLKGTAKSRKQLKEEEENDDGIDYFKASDDDDDDDEDDDGKNYNYADFFRGEAPARPNDRDADDDRTRLRKSLEIKNKTKLKEKRADLGLEDSDVDEDEAEVADEEEDEDEDDVDENAATAKKSGKVKFNLSKNSYRSDSDRSDDEDGGSDVESGKNKAVTNDDAAERSTHEQRQERLRLRIQDMEDQAMGEKSWQLRGEINSENRPQNSLLEEVLEFDSTVRPAPIITEETTLRLEDIIRQRIKDKSWNDVERKFKPVNTPQEFRKKLVLDQEKSKESLAQIYEKEYVKEMDKLKPNGGDAGDDKDADEPKEHTEIRKLMKEVFGKLDALANFYFTPKVAKPDVRIISNVAAINMEEVAPIAVSDAALLAPEEVRPRDKGDAVGKSERTSTDKNRERRQKKQKQRSIAKRQEQKEAEKAAKGVVSSTAADKKKLLAKVSKSRNVIKMKESSDVRSIKSSKQFFSQLQDEVTTVGNGVKSKSKSGKRKQVDANQANAKKFKF